MSRPLVRFFATALVASVPQLAAAQDDPPGEWPYGMPELISHEYDAYACLSTPFGRECHQLEVRATGSLSDLWDGWGPAPYYWPTLWVTVSGFALVPTAGYWVGAQVSDPMGFYEPLNETDGLTGPYRRSTDIGPAYTEFGTHPMSLTSFEVVRLDGTRVELDLIAGRIPVVTPEPATVALLAGGLLVIGGVSVRRRRA